MVTSTHPTQEKNKTNYDRMLRWPDVHPIVGICRSHANQLAAKGLFPKSRQLIPGSRAVFWVESEIQEFVHQRIAAASPTDTEKE